MTINKIVVTLRWWDALTVSKIQWKLHICILFLTPTCRVVQRNGHQPARLYPSELLQARMETPSILPRPKDVDCSRKRKTKSRVDTDLTARYTHKAWCVRIKQGRGNTGNKPFEREQFQVGSPWVVFPRRYVARKPGQRWEWGQMVTLRIGHWQNWAWILVVLLLPGWPWARDSTFLCNTETVIAITPSVKLED